MNKLLVICGPTAAGKTDLGVYLAKKFNGEIISADSRQVYKGMDIITGKDLSKDSKLEIQNSKLNIDNKCDVGFRKKEDIPVWLVDIVEPNYPFNVGEYCQMARKVSEYIWSRNKLVIIVGGSGLYIKSIIEPLKTVIIPPNNKLRKLLDKETVDSLQEKLKTIDLKKLEKMNNSDRANPRRLIRAIEITQWEESNPYMIQPDKPKIDSILKIGLKSPNKILFDRIDKRIEQRMREGVIEEVKKLIEKKYPPYLNSVTTTGFEDLNEYLKGKESLNEAVNRWKFKEKEYAKRQITWFKKDKKISWFDTAEKDYRNEIEKLVGKWYTS